MIIFVFCRLLWTTPCWSRIVRHSFYVNKINTPILYIRNCNKADCQRHIFRCNGTIQGPKVYTFRFFILKTVLSSGGGEMKFHGMHWCSYFFLFFTIYSSPLLVDVGIWDALLYQFTESHPYWLISSFLERSKPFHIWVVKVHLHKQHAVSIQIRISYSSR